MNAVRAGMDSARTEPLTIPTQMKSKKVTLPDSTIYAMTSVATPFSIWAHMITGFFLIRSASTPPTRENTTWGNMNAIVTQASFMGDTVIS